MQEYQSLSDERLIALYKEGDLKALEFILAKYKNLVRLKVRSYFLIGADNEDLVQEGMIGLFKAVRNYDPQKEASFKSFADLCVTRQMITAIKTATRQKHQPLNSYVSLNKSVYEDDSEKQLAEIISAKDENDPEKLFIVQENLDKIYEKIEQRLSTLEKRVIKLYMQGYSYQQIGEILDKKYKSIDNALQRVKNKLEDI